VPAVVAPVIDVAGGAGQHVQALRGLFPYLGQTHMRTHYSNETGTELIGSEIILCGWVQRRRDHGGVIFLDLRDREGLIQIVVDPSQDFLEAQISRNKLK